MQWSKSQHDIGDWECLPRYAWFKGHPIRLVAPDEPEILFHGWWIPFASIQAKIIEDPRRFNAGPA